MTPETFKRLDYIWAVDKATLRNRSPRDEARGIYTLLELFFDNLMQKSGALYIDEDYHPKYPANEPNEWGISGRQFYCREAVLRNIEEGKLLDAYYEYLDFLADYSDEHNNRFYRNELDAIAEPYAKLKAATKARMESTDTSPRITLI